jgi:hypothetical protein
LYASITALWCFSAQAQVPVGDPLVAAGVQAVGAAVGAQNIAAAEEYLKQYERWQQQVQQYQTTINSIKGSTVFASVFNGADLNLRIPTDPRQLLSMAKASPHYQAELQKLGTPKNSAQRKYFESIAADASLQLDFMVKAAQRLTNVQNLQNLIVKAIDPKEKQDLANRLSAEQAAIQADSNIIALYKENRSQQLAELELNKKAVIEQESIDAICRNSAGIKSQRIKTKYGCTNY